MKILLLLIAATILFIILDLAWFQFAGNFFKSQVGLIARLTSAGSWNVRLLPALLVYVLMAAGVLLFVVPQATGVRHALMLGGIFGCIGYGLYDLTNLATLTAWTTSFAVVDITWGTVACALVSTATYALSKTPFFS